ncbi:MAG: hypothetical protein IT450_03535 [Phycisphaerales bacterium]|nr:hypothetical protein [Phycisphaerales bacterium]
MKRIRGAFLWTLFTCCLAFGQDATQPANTLSRWQVSKAFHLEQWPGDTRVTPWMRAESRGSRVLLLARGGSIGYNRDGSNTLAPHVIYRYDPASGELTEASFDQWKRGVEICVSLRVTERVDRVELRPSKDPFRRHGREACLGDKPLGAVGKLDMGLMNLPGDAVGVLSAAQWRPHGAYHMAGERLAGCYFYQEFSKLTGRPLSESQHLSLPIESGTVFGVSTIDGTTIAFWSEDVTTVCFVERGASSEVQASTHPSADIGVWRLGTAMMMIPLVRVSPNGDILIAKNDPSNGTKEIDTTKGIARLNVSTGAVASATQEEWDSAKDVDMRAASRSDHGSFETQVPRLLEMGRVPFEGPKLHHKGVALATVGEADIRLIDLEGGGVAVLSALSFDPGGLLRDPFAKGCYFQSVWSADGKLLSGPTHLPLPIDSGFVWAGLLPDKKRILYLTAGLEWASVCPIDRVGKE